MSLTIPTDSLNKFLAIGGIVAMVYVADICLKNYEKAEIMLIKLDKDIAIFGTAVKRYSEVNSLRNDRFDTLVRTNNRDPQLQMSEIKHYFDNIENLDSIHKEIDLLKIQAEESEKLTNLQLKLRNFWLTLTIVCVIILSALSAFGFYRWFKASNKNTN
ncbi:hypothetical protein [Acinetobacter equi]|uniref:Chemotaxis methyl-accepting receptor HlyB-like 4HB MCP domain-containing protein n=1 Tax=Acinetobacter equi TaxID=1324350 RepID=A0A0N9V8U5_9GAMM|nr:hypothetical protein [Acinetobacter equi]ALH95605.1 hypothetical protein AOY20_08745 [Acinetobacter equi]